MKVLCIANTGESLRPYELTTLKKEELGRFETTGSTILGGVEIGKVYLVMGIITGQSSLTYLIDDGGIILAYPYPLFNVIDHKVPPNWFFRSLKNTDERFPYTETIFGYYELVFDDTHYEKLVEMDEDAHRLYFRRKIELENLLLEGDGD